MERVEVTTEELATAMAIWLTVMPRHVWNELEKYELLAKERRQTGHRPDPKRAVADHIAAKMKAIDWRVTRKENGNIFADRAPGERKP